MGQSMASCHAATPAGGRVFAFRPRLRVPRSVTPLRALYAEDGLGPSWLARALDGRRITCSGFPGPIPGGAAGWFAIGESLLQPCPACGGDHHWPVGVLLVHAPRVPHPAEPLVAVTVHGVLDASPTAVASAGRLVLREATLPGD